MIMDALITDAMACAGTEATVHNFDVWEFDGGRACPIGWGDCSQAVFKHKLNGHHDYGQVGGPGHADCKANCKHGMQPADATDDIDAEVAA